MNIFYLDSNPQVCARYHCDRHVTKMTVETAQIISTVINKYFGTQLEGLYTSTHEHHPCVIWAGESMSNFKWLLELLYHLNMEYVYRWNKKVDHASFERIASYFAKYQIPAISDNWESTTPALAMPEYCKLHFDPVASYRNYYNLEKKHIHKWTNREVPEWIV